MPAQRAMEYLHDRPVRDVQLHRQRNHQLAQLHRQLACLRFHQRPVEHRRHHHERADLQRELQRNASAVDAQRGQELFLGVVYTYGHAFDYEDNGAGTGASGTTFNYPAYYKLNRASAGFDVKHNVQVWSIYSLPFGHGQKWANHGIADEIIGGFS